MSLFLPAHLSKAVWQAGRSPGMLARLPIGRESWKELPL